MSIDQTTTATDEARKIMVARLYERSPYLIKYIENGLGEFIRIESIRRIEL